MIVGMLKQAEKKLDVKMETDLQNAYQFLRTQNFFVMGSGKVTIDGDRMFAVVQEYDTSDKEELQYESHDKYVDVQYMVSGQEKILICDKGDVGEVSIPYDAEGDIVFYEDPGREPKELFLSAGEYAVFWPEDCHKTRCNVLEHEKTPVKKVIVKIKV